MKVLFIAVMLAAAAPTVLGQKRDDLIGTWKLASAWSTRPNGERVALYGQHPIGFLTYMRDGRMTVVLGDSERPQLSTDDRLAIPVAERAAAFSTLQPMPVLFESKVTVSSTILRFLSFRIG